MTTIRWNPLREIATMQSVMDRLFDETWRATSGNGTAASFPLEVHETNQAYTVVAELPGLSPERIDVRMHDGVLTISADLAQAALPEGTRVLLSERTTGKFNRSLRLPMPVLADQVEATYEDGLLTLHLPKAPEAQPRQIPIKAHQPTLISSN
jgi:HSP20 family protein